MEQKDKLIPLIKKQITIEKEHVKRITELEKKVRNAAAKLLLLEMRLDSEKHAGILTGILETLKGVPPSKTYGNMNLKDTLTPLS